MDERLADRDYGEWAGRSSAVVAARWGSLDAAPGVEPATAVRARALAALEDLAARVGTGSAAAVAHDAVNRLVLTALAPSLGDSDALAQEPGCCNVVDRGDDGWSMVAVGVVPRHGAGLLGQPPGGGRRAVIERRGTGPSGDR